MQSVGKAGAREDVGGLARAEVGIRAWRCAASWRKGISHHMYFDLRANNELLRLKLKSVLF